MDFRTIGGKMLPMPYQPVDPPKPCQVLIDGTWYTGQVEAWRKVEGHISNRTL